MRATLVMTWVVLASTGCRGEPDDLFFYFGRVRDVEDRSITGQSLELARGTLPFCYGPYREATLWGKPPVYEPLTSATSDENGEFLFELFRFQLERVNGEPRCLRVMMHGLEPGVRTVTQFPGTAQDTDLPPLLRWEGGAVGIGQAAGGLELTAPAALPWPIPTEHFDPRTWNGEPWKSYEWQVLQGELPAWRAAAEDTTVLLEPELLEDFASLRVGLEVMSFDASASSGMVFGAMQVAVHSRAALTEIAPGAATPISRGARCDWQGKPLDPCPLTDGKLDLARLEPPDPMRPPEGLDDVELIRLTLPRPTAARKLVLRDFQMLKKFRVEGTSDGSTWAELGEHAPEEDVFRLGEVGAFLSVPLAPSAQPVTAIRLMGMPYGLAGARELSVFE